MTINRMRILGAVVASASIAGCSSKDMRLPDADHAATTGALGDPTAFQLLATGLMADYRGLRSGTQGTMTIIGRERYTFTPQEGRNTTNPLIGIVVNGVQKLDPNGF